MKKYQSTFLFLIVSTIMYSQSRLDTVTFYSPSLEVEKSYLVYLPEDYDTNDSEYYPSVYFLLTREIQWFNPLLRSDGTSLKNVLDDLMGNEQIGRMIIVTPNTGGNTVDTEFGVLNMLRPDLSNDSGIGTGNFEDYFIQDLIPHVDSTYRTIPEWCARGIDGFSIGGYASTLYGLKHPGIFSSVGCYDGTLMSYDDFENSPYFDPSFSDWFEPMFNSPFDTTYMKANSPIHLLLEVDPITLDSIKEIGFHISGSVVVSGSNLILNQEFVDILGTKGISNSFNMVELDPNSEHNQDWADYHATLSLVKHWETFSSLSCDLISSANTPNEIRQLKLLQSFPNPVTSLATIEFEITTRGHINLDIFDSFGNHLISVLSSEFNQGMHQIPIDMSSYPNGIYYYQLESDNHIDVKKLLVIR